MSENRVTREGHWGEEGESRGLGREVVLRGSCWRATGMVLESSKHNSRGLEPLGDLGAGRTAQTWLDLTVAPRDPGTTAKTLGSSPVSAYLAL